MKTLACLMLTMLLAVAGPAQPAVQADVSLAEQLAEIIETDRVSERTIVAMQVIDAETSDVLFQRFPDHLLVPASNMKLYSSACALDVFGPDHRFETRVLATGAIDSDGVLRGDLVLQAGGDPVLRSEQLAALAREVAGKGVKRIEGALVVDDTIFEPRLKGPGWMWDDDPDTYNMSVNALMVDYNVLTVVMRERDGRHVVELDPPSDYPPLEVSGPLPGRLVVTRKPFDHTITVSSRPSPEATTARVRLTMHDPTRWAAGMFAEMLRGEGIEIAGGVRVADQPAMGEAIAVHRSVPMSEILALFNKPSENAIGEVLVHQIALNAGVRPATWNAGARAIGEWLTGTAGLDAGDFRMVDGSGLSRYNLICASGTVKLLHHMNGHPHRQVYIDSLPVIGVDGTTAGRGQNTAARGSVFAKTGTMSGVSCLSGYVETASGRTLVFSILTNGFVGSSAPPRALQDRLCAAMAAWEE